MKCCARALARRVGVPVTVLSLSPSLSFPLSLCRSPAPTPPSLPPSLPLPPSCPLSPLSRALSRALACCRLRVTGHGTPNTSHSEGHCRLRVTGHASRAVTCQIPAASWHGRATRPVRGVRSRVRSPVRWCTRPAAEYVHRNRHRGRSDSGTRLRLRAQVRKGPQPSINGIGAIGYAAARRSRTDIRVDAGEASESMPERHPSRCRRGIRVDAGKASESMPERRPDLPVLGQGASC